MATLVIRNVDDDIHRRLKEQAASHGHSMEAEVLVILAEDLQLPEPSPPGNWVDSVRALFEPLGWLDLPPVYREPTRDPPDFSGEEWADYDADPGH